MMSRHVFECLKLSIHIDIHWKIDKYDSKINVKLNEHDLIDVYHEIFVDIDDVEMKPSIFVKIRCYFVEFL